MRVYLVQHGEAVPKEVDPARPLSEAGRQAVWQTAKLSARLGLEVAQVRHSGKLRAEQTAALFGAALHPPGDVVAVPGLAPRDDVRPVADALAHEPNPIMLVGHMPFLQRLSGLLLCGDPEAQWVRFHKGGVLCLERIEGGWQVVWLLAPEMAAS